MKKNKNISVTSIIIFLKEKGFIPIRESQVKLNKSGQKTLKENQFEISKGYQSINLTSINTTLAKKANKLLKSNGFKTAILIQRKNFIAIRIRVEL